MAPNSFGAGGGGASQFKNGSPGAPGVVIIYEYGGGSGGGGGGSGTPGGNTTEIQFNSGGSFAGDANFVWDAASAKLSVTGDIDYTGYLTDVSDRRLKENITPLEHSLEGIWPCRDIPSR